MSKDSILDERMVVAVEKIAQSFSRIANSLEEKNDFNSDWGERLEYYLHLVKSQKEIKHGFTFLNDTAFKEVGGKICGASRNNYTGLYSVNDTIIILNPTNGNKFSFKVNSKSIKLMELVLTK